MSQFNSKVDEYIALSADFAKPILEHWRQIIHDTCPDVEEAIKWGIPHFDYKGEMMCILAAYKQHCSFSFWKAELMSHPKLKENTKLKPVIRYLGKITSLSDLPPDSEIIGYIKEAMALNENGIKIKAAKSEKPKVIELPDYFAEKLATNLVAKEIFDRKSSSFRKDYLIWITDAKTDATLQSRMDEALEWIAEGKGRFWKYNK